MIEDSDLGSGTGARSPLLSDAIDRGFSYLEKIQAPDGSWAVDYDGPLFLLPGYVFAHYVTGTPLGESDRTSFIATIRRAQNPDGSFGFHLDGRGYQFSTVLNYVALRLLGVPADDVDAKRARDWFLPRGGAAAVPSWGKHWLSVLNLYSWEGCHPVPPELWLLPRILPIHPSRFWCQCRLIVLVVSYLYGRRFQAAIDPTLAALRGELYAMPFDAIDWRSMRDAVYAGDRYRQPSRLLHIANAVLGWLEPRIPARLRAYALRFVFDHITHEMATTGYIDIGPVNKALNAIAVWSDDPLSEHTRKSLDALPVYLFDCERGRTMQTYNSSQTWDTSLAALSLAAAGRTQAFSRMAAAAYRFIDRNQIREDVDQRERYFRDSTKGGWTFSTGEQGWPVADCTAFALIAALALEPVSEEPIAPDRLLDAVDLLLFWQNRDGGWGTYEKQRGPAWLEALNASEVFSGIMVDMSEVELTSSAIQALTAARSRVAGCGEEPRIGKIVAAITRGERFLRSLQRADGSWEGNWGICFTYGTWFGISGLRAAGAGIGDPAIERATAFLAAKQCSDGGWGESHESCIQRRYIQHPDGGQLLMTAWALLGLLNADASRFRAEIERGLRFLMERQRPNGDWPQQGMTGFTNRTLMINYRLYRNYFPLYALALAERWILQSEPVAARAPSW